MLWQAEADWAGDASFHQLSPEGKSVLDTLLAAQHMPQQGKANLSVSLLSDRSSRYDCARSR